MKGVKDKMIYMNLYTSSEKLEAFREGYSQKLDLYDTEHKSPLDTILLSVPISRVYYEDDVYFIERVDFVELF